MTEKHAGGRPRKYKTVAEMSVAIDDYFDETAFDKITITGLALYLGFTSRADLINYEGYSEEFHYTIKKAKLFVENAYEQDLRSKGGSGPIFALKNFDWKDKHDVKHEGGINIVYLDKAHKDL